MIDMRSIEAVCPTCTRYTRQDIDGNIVVAAVKEEGVWKDITEIEQRRQEVARLQEELEHLEEHL